MAAVKKEKGIEPALQNTQVGYFLNDRGGFCHLSKSRQQRISLTFKPTSVKNKNGGLSVLELF